MKEKEVTILLIKCQECESDVSDKAVICPHCGCPINSEKILKMPARHLRLPNGFGQITKIKGKNLRKPYRAMITVGKDEKGKPICKLLKPESYFKTYNEAYAALVLHNNGSTIHNSEITLSELYDMWYERSEKNGIRQKTLLDTRSTWQYYKPIQNLKVSAVHVSIIEECIRSASVKRKGKIINASDNTKSRMKTLMSKLLDEAVANGITDKNYANFVVINKKIAQVTDLDIPDEASEDTGSHIDFTNEEMVELWKNAGKIPYVDVILFDCYSGWRPSELCVIKMCNVDLENWKIISGIKTASGIRRTVPIHSKVRPYVVKWYNQSKSVGSKYLFYNLKSSDYRQMDYFFYYRQFSRAIEEIGLNPQHKPHDCRVHFATNAKKSGMDEYIRKRLMGHKINDITEQAYTKVTFDELSNELEKIR